MKILQGLIYLVFVVTVLSCNNHNRQDEQNVKLVSNYIEAVENLDYDAMDKFLAEGYMGYGPSVNDSINKPQAIANWKMNVESLYEDIHYDQSRVVAITVPDGPNKGNWVSNWAQLNIKYQGTEDDQVVIWANTIYRVEAGKIISSYTFYNEADVMEQLGFFYLHSDQFNN